MAREGSLVAFENVSLSWPKGGLREVIDLPEGKRGPRLKRAVFEGKVIETDLPVTAIADGPAPRLLQGEEARRHFEEPAGPTVRVVSQPSDPETAMATEVVSVAVADLPVSRSRKAASKTT
jgi:hypothetical protein